MARTEGAWPFDLATGPLVRVTLARLRSDEHVAFFTIHHIVALQNYFDPLATAICSVGIFIGGAIWSWCYIRYRSIWPGYLSHAIVDVAVFSVGYVMVFH